MIIHKKFKEASCHTNCPVPTAIRAKRKMISEEASFSKLSPSRIADVVAGS
jgi:hypothetical protein